jgi:acetyltransferase-like isoleucine patch superfamily enzyme
MDNPELIIGNNVFIGHASRFVVNKKIVLGDYASVAGSCAISDSDGHPTEWDRRAAKAALKEEDIRPVIIGKHVWIGHGAQILKGVTIGERSIIGAGSVVISDVPPDSLAMGSPARVVRAKTT